MNPFVDDEPDGTIPDFNVISPRQTQSERSYGGLLAMILLTAAAGLCGLLWWKQWRASLPAVPVDVFSRAIGVSGTEFRYVFEISNFGDSDFDGSVRITLFREDDSTAGSKTFDFDESPIVESQTVQFDSTVNRAGFKGFSGVGYFRAVIKQHGHATSEVSHDVVESVVDVDRLQDLIQRVEKVDTHRRRDKAPPTNRH